MASTGRNTTFILLIMLSIVVFLFLNMVLGSVRIPMSAVWHIFTGTGDEPQTWQNIIWKSRFPQALTALVAGAGLSISGLQMQTVFRNPLAGPSVLGISSGASMGVAFVVLFSGSIGGVALSHLGLFGEVALSIAAVAGSLSVMALIVFASHKVKGNVTLLIIGVMIGYLANAIIGILNVVAELASNYYISFPNSNCEIAAMLATTIFYLLQALLPFTVICYIQTLHDNKIISAKKMFLSGVPTFILMGMILTNPFTEKLFYFDIPAGYMKGPWYMLMYYSALCHMAAALILIVIWRKKLGYQKVKSLLEILLISGAGVVIQLLYHPLLTTGFGMSLGILVLFITINNPHANIDTLTGLYNHLYLARKSNELISAGKSFHIITVYLYQLKHINKIAGVQGGNSILKLTARKLGEMCGKKAFRTTGKSFMILTGSLEEYEYYLTQLKRMFDGNSKLNVNNKIITMPVIISGIMNAQKLGDSGLILEYAEYLEALSAKNGLTEVIQDDYQTMNGFLYNKRVEQYLHKAITEDLFEIYYQPVYSTRKKCFITLEALSRLQHPELGWIAPDVFIQIAEKNHMIEQITDLQFSRVCRFLGENRYLMRHLLNVKVNLSSLDLMRNDCSRHFIRIMDAYKIPHNWIQFEITETVATECNAGLRRVAEEFTDAGIGLCLDDFGSGYANLNTVMRLPFSVIKVDRSLLFDICRDEKRAIFYESVVETFHKMNYHIVSEGVETQEEMEQISSWGVEMIQGYYFSKPLPEKELLELLKKQDNIER